MQNIELHEIKNNARMDTTACDVPLTGPINIFFPGAADYGNKVPENKLKKAVVEYIDDRKINKLNWKLLFALQKNPHPDPDERDIEKLNRIEAFNMARPALRRVDNAEGDEHGHPIYEEYDPKGEEKKLYDELTQPVSHYLAEHLEFAKEVLLPEAFAANLIKKDGEHFTEEHTKDEVHKAKMRLSRFNLMGFCYGTIAVQQVLLALDRVLRDRGYSAEDRKDIKSSLCCMNYAPICRIPDANKEVPQIFFASGIDQIAKRRIDYTETYGQTAPEYDMHRVGNSVVLVSHLVAPIPKALRLKRETYDYKDTEQSPLTINKDNDGYTASLDAIRKGKVKVSELSVRDDATERMGHNLRTWFNLERLTGTQLRDGKETFAFPSTLFARWAHDILLDSVKASATAARSGKPRDMKAIIDKAVDSLTPEDIARRIEQFHNAGNRYATMVQAARDSDSLVER